MEEHVFKELVGKGLSTWNIASHLSISQSTVRHYLNKYGLKTCVKAKAYLCRECGEKDRDKFYGNSKESCRTCHNKNVAKRANENKKWATQLLGGECQFCGYKKSSWALQFHHLDPSKKDRNFTSMRGWGRDRLEKELSGCILLCANCHLEEHERLHEAQTP